MGLGLIELVNGKRLDEFIPYQTGDRIEMGQGMVRPKPVRRRARVTDVVRCGVRSSREALQKLVSDVGEGLAILGFDGWAGHRSVSTRSKVQWEWTGVLTAKA